MNKISAILFLSVLLSLAGCAPANKDIPDPSGIDIFVNNITGTKSDSSSAVSISMATIDTLLNDTLISLGYEDATQDEILFSIYKTEVGTYPVDLVPLGTAQASFLYRKKGTSGYKNYLMTTGEMKITLVDTVAKRTKGTFNVTNVGAVTDHEYTFQGDFNVKLNPR